MYKWLVCIRKAFVSLNCDALLSQPSMYKVNKSLLKKVIHERWLIERGASTADLELSTKLSRRILDLDDSNDRLDTTYTVRLNLFAEPRSRIAMHTQVLDTRKCCTT